MSHPQPPQRQPTTSEKTDYMRALHTTAIIGAIAGPLLIALPPRKLDIYTFGLAIGTYYSSNYLVEEHTGRSIPETLFSKRPAQPVVPELPGFDMSSAQMEELRRRRQEDLRLAKQDLKARGKEWAVERQEEVEQAVEEGKGFGDMIVDQIKEVVTWGKKDE